MRVYSKVFQLNIVVIIDIGSNNSSVHLLLQAVTKQILTGVGTDITIYT